MNQWAVPTLNLVALACPQTLHCRSTARPPPPSLPHHHRETHLYVGFVGRIRSVLIGLVVVVVESNFHRAGQTCAHGFHTNGEGQAHRQIAAVAIGNGP